MSHTKVLRGIFVSVLFSFQHSVHTVTMEDLITHQETHPDFMQHLLNVSSDDEGREQTFRDFCVEHAVAVREVIVNELGPKLMVLRGDPKLLAITAVSLFSLLLLVARCLCFPSSSKKNRMSIADSIATRRSLVDGRISVSSPYSPARERLLTDDSHSRPLAGHINPDQAAICDHKGASVMYETWTPPTPWTDAAKQLLPNNAKMKSHVTRVQIELDLLDGELRIEDTETACDLHEVQLHVQRAAGAVIELYIQGSKMEHTFLSAQSAAQFQQDLLAFQIVGKAVMNMYHSLELVHRGSEAHTGNEAVLHDSVGAVEVTVSAVAWDDVFRCFGGVFPNLRNALERHTLRVGEEEVLASLAEQYQSRRAMLCHVDFFRLFCPLLPPGSQPRAESSPGRLEKLIELRKQVAQASRYVQSYIRARCVVNKGWKLEWDEDAKRRLAYDDNMENMKHDAVAKNEYYEAIVSRDVVCALQSKQNPDQTLNSVQAYSLVGLHTFRLPAGETDHPLAHHKDPVEAIPSLRRIVMSNPDLDFFCVGMFPGGAGVAVIKLFVRTLPKGVDRSFDTAIGRFTEAEAKVRDRTLELFLQLGPGGGLSPLAWSVIKTISTLLWWTRGSDIGSHVEVGSERTQFPGLCMGHYMQMHHFGGSMQTNAALPKNYIAATAHVVLNLMGNMIFRFLYTRLENGALSASVFDFSYALKANDEDELPERVLGTVRMVHCDPFKVALPIELTAQQNQDEHPSPSINMPSRQMPGTVSIQNMGIKHDALTWRLFGQTTVTDNDDAVSEEKTRGISDFRSRLLKDDEGPFREGLDALIETLDDVRVPVRRLSLAARQLHISTSVRQDQVSHLPPHIRHDDIVNLPVLETLNRSDLRRYFIACNCDLVTAAIRLVESTAWRGITFPIDTRSCRIEMQTGQFFQQGVDLKGNPVFYFRNMCVGPWRQHPDAVISAVLHRLETKLDELVMKKSDVKITLIVLLGRPLLKKKRLGKPKHEKNDDETKVTAENTEGETLLPQGDNNDNASHSETVEDEETSWNPFRMGVNPRLQAGEDYHAHTNPMLIKKLIEIVMAHYPERLHKAILVPGKSRGYGYWRTAVGVQFAIRNSILSSRTRSKCCVLHRVGELKEFVHPSEIITIAGGEAPLQPDAFECTTWE
jgi:hypothetical protein